MPRLKWTGIAALVSLAGMGLAPAAEEQQEAQPAPARGPVPAQRRQAQPRPDPSQMQKLLVKWERQSQLLKSLQSEVYRVDKTPGFDELHFDGMVAFKNPSKAFLDFREVKTKVVPDPKDKQGKKKKRVPVVNPKNNRPESVPFETIVCTGTEVWHYRHDVKQLFIYSLDKNQQRRALEEGPLPFLFNMKAADAQRRYEMVLQGQNEKTYFVMVTPKLQEDKETFVKAWVFLDRHYLLPTRIVLFAPDGQSTQDYNFSSIVANGAVKDERFEGVIPPKHLKWKVERNPAGSAAGEGQAAGRRRGPAGPAARRPPGPDDDQPR
jgi:TIGR03009 family protein